MVLVEPRSPCTLHGFTRWGGTIPMPRNNKNKNKNNKKKAPGQSTPKVKVLTGKGAYSFSDVAKAAKSAVQNALKSESTRSMIATGAGNLAERFVPGSRGSAAALAKFLLNKVSGTGDYTVGGAPKTNSLFKQNKAGEMVEGNALSIPKMHTSGNSIRVSHREYVMDILAPADGQQFNPMVFTINPGDPAVFPWLSNIAQLFEQYKFHGLVFEFVSTTSPYNQSPSMGYVMMAAQYNVLQAPFQSPIELENSTDSIMARPDHCIMYGLECQKQSYNYYYVRNNRNVVVDPATYDFADVTLATKGLPSSYVPGSTIGQLWISFDIELVQPIYELPAGGSCLLAGNPGNVTTTGNFLAPFDYNLGNQPCALNFNGRFTPVSLNGSGKPLFSTNTYTDANGYTQSRLIVELANMEKGNGVLVQLTVTAQHVVPTASNPPATIMTPGVNGNYGATVTIQRTPSFQLSNLVNCGLLQYSPYQSIVENQINSEFTNVRGHVAGSTSVATTVQASTSSTRGLISYTYTWYVGITGSNPGFVIQPNSNYNLDNIMVVGPVTTGEKYSTVLNMTLIKNTDVDSDILFVPYRTPTGVLPTAPKANYLNSMVMNRSFTQTYSQERATIRDDRALLHLLAEKHGLSLREVFPSRFSQKETGSVCDFARTDDVLPQEESYVTEDYERVKPDVPAKRRSLSFSSSF